MKWPFRGRNNYQVTVSVPKIARNRICIIRSERQKTSLSSEGRLYRVNFSRFMNSLLHVATIANDKTPRVKVQRELSRRPRLCQMAFVTNTDQRKIVILFVSSGQENYDNITKLIETQLVENFCRMKHKLSGTSQQEL